MSANSLDGPRAPPARGGRPDALVILAHGYGSNGADLIALAPYLAQALPGAAFVSPNAPEPVPGYPGGFQWFPLANLESGRVAEGARRAAGTLDRFIDGELKRHGLRPRDCALVGFSQGTMMALHVGLRRPEPLGAVVGFSGLLADPEGLAGEIRSRPPVLLAHGDRDPVVPISTLFAAAGGLAAAGVPAMWRISPGAGHTIEEAALGLAADFLRDALAGRFAGWIAPERVR